MDNAFNMNVIRELYASNKKLNEALILLTDKTTNNFSKLENIMHQQNKKLDDIRQQNEVIINIIQSGNQSTNLSSELDAQLLDVQNKLSQIENLNNHNLNSIDSVNINGNMNQNLNQIMNQNLNNDTDTILIDEFQHEFEKELNDELQKRLTNNINNDN
jgi:hypothetical protein